MFDFSIDKLTGLQPRFARMMRMMVLRSLGRTQAADRIANVERRLARVKAQPMPRGERLFNHDSPSQ